MTNVTQSDHWHARVLRGASEAVCVGGLLPHEERADDLSRPAAALEVTHLSDRHHGPDTKNWYSRQMGKNTSFSLDEHFSAFIDSEVSSGRYRSASDVVRSALRLLEEREIHLTTLRNALIDGERSGPSAEFDFDAFLARKREPNRR